MACNEFLGIGNEESPIVHYGMSTIVFHNF